MPLRARTRPPVAAPAWWGLFASWMGLDAPAGLRLWQRISASRHPTVRAWCTTVRYIRGAVRDRAYILAIMAGPLAPKRVVAVLEALVEEGELTRKEATQAEECIFKQITRDGHWT